MRTPWDLVVVGAGPAGAATALGALRADPGLRVALLDRCDFPRDKSCGDGVAPHVIDLLESAGVQGVVHDRVPIDRLRLDRGALRVDRRMRRPAWVIPRKVFDHRLTRAAQDAGATLVRHRVARLDDGSDCVTLDDTVHARVVVGADGAYSSVARALGRRTGPLAVALRGYSPTPPGCAGSQVIVFGTTRQPAYAWSFDRGDGLANVGYGEMLTCRDRRPTRVGMLEQLEALLPGSTAGGHDWRGHLLPLSTRSWRPPQGRVLLVGDAAGLVNPMTGEGIYYAVATGLAAGRAAAEAVAAGRPESAGTRYSRLTRPILRRHLRHTAAAARLCRSGLLLDAGIRASTADQRVFDDLVELGLARGRITPAMVRAIAGTLVGRQQHPFPARTTQET